MMPDCEAETVGLHDLLVGESAFWRTECWVKVWNCSDHPVLVNFAVFVLGFSDSFTVFKINQDGWWRHVLVTRAHRTGTCLGLFSFVFCEVCGSSGSFGGYDDPAVEEVIFPSLL